MKQKINKENKRKKIKRKKKKAIGKKLKPKNENTEI